MVKLFFASGYDSWNEKTITRVFRQPSEAEQFASSLTDGKVQIFSSIDNIQAFNSYLIDSE
jgi:hypothetical protein